MNLTRRRLLTWGTLVAGGAAACFAKLRADQVTVGRFGPLVADPNELLELPEGFSYRVIAQTGVALDHGALRRALPDGMAAFAADNGHTVLMVNHELAEVGGVSRILLDKDLRVLEHNDVLVGTNRNCAGGPSPWGWLSCEEVEFGGVWLCPTNARRPRTPVQSQRIDDYGSFKHEAVCIDPSTLTAYLTEDDGESHLYRMVPYDKELDPLAGTLQVLSHPPVSSFDTSKLEVGDSFPVAWIDVDPADARKSAKSQGAAVFHRCEGIWYSEEGVFFTATASAQLFRLLPNEDRVEVWATALESPDNITVTPWGDVLVAEDQFGYCRLRLVEGQGRVSDFARNVRGRGEELAGVCFSPTGDTLFVNLQKSGHTLAIRGPFPDSDFRG